MSLANEEQQVRPNDHCSSQAIECGRSSDQNILILWSYNSVGTVQ